MLYLTSRYTISSHVDNHSLQCSFLCIPSHKDHRQLCMLLHVNCYTVGTLIICFLFDSFFITCTKVIIFKVLKI
jgi:hypothetical protein